MTQAKTKQIQKKDKESVSERDCFWTPRYATELLIPFLRKVNSKVIWECAAGKNAITNVLSSNGFSVISSDLMYDIDLHDEHLNFLNQWTNYIVSVDTIVTNPPFSLKKEFYQRCMASGKKWALLIPADYSGWICEAIQKGCQRITPNRRIDYLTPNVVNRVNANQIMKEINKNVGYRMYKKTEEMLPSYIEMYGKDAKQYTSIYEIPNELLQEVSSSDFHSYWLTWGFNLSAMEIIVDLPNSQKINII